MSNYSVGSLVKFRGREWVVMPSQVKDMLELRPLTGSDEDVCGVYLPLEARKLEPTTFPAPSADDIGDFEAVKLFRDSARLLLRHGAGPFRSLGHLTFRPRPYQFVPLLMALRINPVRMLIADDVGIGKTIEAAMVARELLDRGEVKRLAVICPPYLCDQWQKELQEKFNIDAKIIRTSTIARLERNLPRPNLSVFEYYPYIVVSVEFVKSQRRRDIFLLHCPELVIVDEAHGCARPPGQSVAQQQRHRLLFDLAQDKSKHLILVTATPHSGIDESFLSLVGFIKPHFEHFDLDTLQQEQRAEMAQYFIQRRRVDIINWLGQETFFPERDPLEISFALSPEYKQLFNDVYRFVRGLVASSETQTGTRRRVRYWAALALLRCVMSSPAAAKAALLARIERLAESDMAEDTDYTSYVFDQTEIESIVDVIPKHVVAEGESSFSEGEKRKLREFSRRAESLKGTGDNKIAKTEKEIRTLLRQGFKPIVFCRYIATSDYVAEELQKRLKSEFPNLHIISVTGALSEEEREIWVEELCKSSKRVLVATDCMGEGINLQDGFNAVIHYDLPWNPNRLEQREGRVDRFGQKSPTVKAILLYGADNPIDGAVLNVLLRKARKIHRSLKIMVPIPVSSKSVMETVLKALFWRTEPSPQLDLFFNEEAPIVEVHRQWDRNADREKKSRALFAQHAIKPDEVESELDAADSVLGDPKVVENFIRSASQRVGATCSKVNGYCLLDSATLPPVLKTKLSDLNISKITFEQPEPADVAYISRNHLLTKTLAEYLFDNAIRLEGDSKLSSRCGVIRSRDVDSLTTLLLLRIRFLIEGRGLPISVAEECCIAGFKGMIGSESWLSFEDAEMLFELASPSSNISSEEKKHWIDAILGNFHYIKKKTDEMALNRAEALLQSYRRVRKAIQEKQVSVKPLLPGDILALSIIVPQP